MADQVEEVKAKTDIVSVIGEHIELKKAGTNYKATCPFHSEKTPSFVVSPEIQIFKCFGCGEAGDVIAFLEKYEGMDFYEALKLLADKAGVKLKRQRSAKSSKKQKLYEINSQINRFYQYVLLKHPSGKHALDYLTKHRKIGLSSIKHFKLGYSPNQPFAVRRHLVDKMKVSVADIKETGVVYERNGRLFDRFRGRITFPLFDHRGNAVGVAGRILPSDEKKDLAKYINSPETDVYHKSSVLYGFNYTKNKVKKIKEAVIVEGELDLISSWQAGIENVVAIKGSSLTQEQVKLLARYANSLVLALDADVAGDKAAMRGIEIAEKEGLGIKVAKLGDYKDPDEMAIKDPKGLKKAVRDACDVWEFIIDSVFNDQRGVGGRAKAPISKKVVPVLGSIEDKIVQAHYTKLVAARLGVPIDAVAAQISSLKPQSRSDSLKKENLSGREKKGRRELLENRVLSLVFKYNLSLLNKKKIYTLIRTPLCARIAEEFRRFAGKDKKVNPSEFAAKLSSELETGYIDMVLGDLELKSDHFEKELELLVRELKILDIKEELGETARLIQKLEKEKSGKKLKSAEMKFGKLTKLLSEFEAEEFKGIILG